MENNHSKRGRATLSIFIHCKAPFPIMPWTSYSSPFDWEKRLDVVKTALGLCAELEHRNLVDGFNVFMTKEAEKDPWISIRVDIKIKQDKDAVRQQLQAKFPKLELAPYSESNEIARMYEPGSRLALEYYELVEKGRGSLDDRLDLWKFHLAFHGLLNNIGLDSSQEARLHFNGLVDRGFKINQSPWRDIAQAACSKAIELGVFP